MEEHMEEKMVEQIIYTTCPEDYDYSQATTVDARAGRMKTKIVRKVLIRQNQYRVDYQIGRYRSTMCELCADEAEWQKLLECGLATTSVVERDPQWD